jgi:hypothetical protein
VHSALSNPPVTASDRLPLSLTFLGPSPPTPALIPSNRTIYLGKATRVQPPGLTVCIVESSKSSRRASVNHHRAFYVRSSQGTHTNIDVNGGDSSGVHVHPSFVSCLHRRPPSFSCNKAR